MIRSSEERLKKFNKELTELNKVYHLLKEQDQTNITESNLLEKISELTNYTFKESTIQILRDDFFKTD